MPSTPPSDARDVADLLEAIAKRLRSDPGFVREITRVPTSSKLSVAAPASAELTSDETPDFGEVDVVMDEGHITVTAETRNVDQASIHVSVMDRQLILCIGEGDDEKRRDVALPSFVDEDAAVATFRNGILDVVLPVRDAQGQRSSA